MQNKNESVQQWSAHSFGAFLAGAWQLYWTSDSLFWLEKPTTKIETGSFGRRLHCEHGPACANAVENLYFWHGVMVPAYAVVEPSLINLKEINGEQNNEVRRILIDRFGWERYLKESGAQRIHRRFNERDQQWEELYRTSDGMKRTIVSDPSTGRRYALGVPREIETCDQAQTWMSHGLDLLAVHRS